MSARTTGAKPKRSTGTKQRKRTDPDQLTPRERAAIRAFLREHGAVDPDRVQEIRERWRAA